MSNRKRIKSQSVLVSSTIVAKRKGVKFPERSNKPANQIERFDSLWEGLKAMFR